MGSVVDYQPVTWSLSVSVGVHADRGCFTWDKRRSGGWVNGFLAKVRCYLRVMIFNITLSHAPVKR